MTATDAQLTAAGQVTRRITILRAQLGDLKRSFVLEKAALENQLVHLEQQAYGLLEEIGPVTTVYGSIRWRKSARTVTPPDADLLVWASEHVPAAVHHATSATALVAHGCRWVPGPDRDTRVMVTGDGELVPGVVQEVTQVPAVVAGKQVADLDVDDAG